MTKRIEEDHRDFIDVYSGKTHKKLKEFMNNGSIFRKRGDGKTIHMTIPRIDIPQLVYGDNGKGVGRGPGKDGDVIKKKKGKGKKGKATDDVGDGTVVAVDMEEIFKFLKEELQLPDLQPKETQTYDEIRIKYNNIAMQGPESLRHNRRTMLQAMKRMCASGEINNLTHVPGQAEPMRIITPINSDKRYRQYREIKIPSSNAVIFFARDGSGLMDQTKCEIVSDMAYWIDLWVRRFYDKVERRYIWHDTEAKEVDEKTFYSLRYGGGTKCSSALQRIDELMENNFPPEKWNIYIIYFTDGDNFDNDNENFNKVIKEKFPPNLVNMIGITQILSMGYQESLKQSVDKANHAKNVRTAAVDSSTKSEGGWQMPSLSEEERNSQIKKAIMKILGNGSDSQLKNDDAEPMAG